MKKIELFGKKGKGKFVLISNKDFEKLSKYKWYLGNNIKENPFVYCGIYYKNLYKKLGRTKSTKTIRIHHKILNVPKGMVVDHIDGNGLNNQRFNLRICLQRENARNRSKGRNNKSGYKGVCWYKQRKKWVAQIMSQKKNIFLGSFFSKKQAAFAYNKAAKKYHKKFARLNTMV